MTDTLILLILIGIMIVIALILPQYLVTRVVPNVIKILRENNALDEKHAASTESLGLTAKPPWKRLGLRDYKPKAVQLLIKMNVVKTNQDGYIYLDEKELKKTIWSNL